MGKPIYHSCGHNRIYEDFIPSLKGEIGGNYGRFSSRPKGEMGKEQFGSFFIKGYISKAHQL